MNDPKNEPAFVIESDFVENVYHGGLTKREYFAAKAMQACIISFTFLDSDVIVKTSIELTDKILEELTKEKK